MQSPNLADELNSQTVRELSSSNPKSNDTKASGKKTFLRNLNRASRAKPYTSLQRLKHKKDVVDLASLAKTNEAKVKETRAPTSNQVTLPNAILTPYGVTNKANADTPESLRAKAALQNQSNAKVGQTKFNSQDTLDAAIVPGKSSPPQATVNPELMLDTTATTSASIGGMANISNKTSLAGKTTSANQLDKAGLILDNQAPNAFDADSLLSQDKQAEQCRQYGKYEQYEQSEQNVTSAALQSFTQKSSLAQPQTQSYETTQSSTKAPTKALSKSKSGRGDSRHKQLRAMSLAELANSSKADLPVAGYVEDEDESQDKTTSFEGNVNAGTQAAQNTKATQAETLACIITDADANVDTYANGYADHSFAPAKTKARASKTKSILNPATKRHNAEPNLGLNTNTVSTPQDTHVPNTAQQRKTSQIYGQPEKADRPDWAKSISNHSVSQAQLNAPFDINMASYSNEEAPARFELLDDSCPNLQVYLEMCAAWSKEESTAADKLSQFYATQQATSPQAETQLKNEASRHELVVLMPNAESGRLRHDNQPLKAQYLSSNDNSVTSQAELEAIPESGPDCVAHDLRSARQAFKAQQALRMQQTTQAQQDKPERLESKEKQASALPNELYASMNASAISASNTTMGLNTVYLVNAAVTNGLNGSNTANSLNASNGLSNSTDSHNSHSLGELIFNAIPEYEKYTNDATCGMDSTAMTNQAILTASSLSPSVMAMLNAQSAVRSAFSPTQLQSHTQNQVSAKTKTQAQTHPQVQRQVHAQAQAMVMAQAPVTAQAPASSVQDFGVSTGTNSATTMKKTAYPENAASNAAQNSANAANYANTANADNADHSLANLAAPHATAMQTGKVGQLGKAGQAEHTNPIADFAASTSASASTTAPAPITQSLAAPNSCYQYLSMEINQESFARNKTDLNGPSVQPLSQEQDATQALMPPNKTKQIKGAKPTQDVQDEQDAQANQMLTQPEPFAEYESTYNAVYMPRPCASIHKLTQEEEQEETAKNLAYKRTLHRLAVSTEIDENTLRNNPMLMSVLTNGNAARQILPAGHHPSVHPKKDLIENVKHGTSLFPFACYVWVPQNYSYRVALHWHPEVELVRFNKGLFKISIDMQDTVIEDNAFMLLPGNIMHTFTMPPNCEESALVFDPHMLFLQNYDEVQSEILEALITGNMPLPPVITPEHPCFAKIDTLYTYCVEHGSTTNASHRLMIKAKLLEILAIYHEYGLISRKEVHTNIKRSKQDKLKELLNYIDSHYAGPITIKDASNRLGVTDQYFCRFFKRVTGMSFTEYLNDLRLRRAAKEIELTNRSISDIAYEHGFENVGYFFKSFKNKFSMTPLKYRKKHVASLPK